MLTLGRHPAPHLPMFALCAAVAAVVACGGDAAGPGSSVEFVTQPSTTIAGRAVEPAVEVTVRDAFGRPLEATVTLELDPNPCNWQLGGTLTAKVSDETARFEDLIPYVVGQGYTLRASSEGASATSVPFDVRSHIVTESVYLENVLCARPNVGGDGESLAYVPVDDSFWLADDNRNTLSEVDRLTGAMGAEIRRALILGALPDVRACDDGDGDPETTCSYVNQFEQLAYDEIGQALLVLNTVDSPADRPAIFRLTRGTCAGCFTPESWQPLPPESSYSGISVVGGQIYLALSRRIYAYDYDSNELVTLDANGNSLRPAYVTPRPVVEMSYDGEFMWILTNDGVLRQVDWSTLTESRTYELDPFDFSLPRGVEVVRDTIYILEGDSPNPIYVLTQHRP